MGGRDAGASLERYPALTESRARLLDLARGGAPHSALVEAIEADPALAMPVLRLANRRPGHAGTVGSVSDAVRVLPAGTLAAVAETTPTADRLEPVGRWGSLPERFRLHAVSVSRIAQRLAGVLGGGVMAAFGGDAVDALVTAALLHDVGKLVIHAREPSFVADAESPDERLEAERAAFGHDHAELGARVAREWGLPERLAELIERHHSAVDGGAAVLKLADVLNHYAAGRPVDLPDLVELAKRVGLGREALSELLYELPHALPLRPREPEPCPLSSRELEVLRRLGGGMVSKEIARDLEVAESTVRNHLHHIYGRLEVADRTQAVLLARECGWI
jgi:putative nucleotidyltransferase with HDIG domain